jgi:hypothetical protein
MPEPQTLAICSTLMQFTWIRVEVSALVTVDRLDGRLTNATVDPSSYAIAAIVNANGDACFCKTLTLTTYLVATASRIYFLAGYTSAGTLEA